MTIDWPAAYRNVEKRIADNERACREEREHFVARAIKSRVRRKQPLNGSASSIDSPKPCLRSCQRRGRC